MSQRGRAEPGLARQEVAAPLGRGCAGLTERGPALSHATGSGARGGRARAARPPAFLLPSAHLALERGRRWELLSGPLADPAPGTAGRAGPGRSEEAANCALGMHRPRWGAGARPAGCPGLPAPSLPSSGPSPPFRLPALPCDRGPAWPGSPRWVPLPFSPAPWALRPRPRPLAARALAQAPGPGTAHPSHPRPCSLLPMSFCP